MEIAKSILGRSPRYLTKLFIVVFGAISSSISFILDIGNNLTEKLLVSLIIVLVFLSLLIIYLWIKLDDVRDDLEEQKEYSNMIDEKYTQPVAVKKKEIEVKMTDGGDDEVKYTHNICALDDYSIEKFYGLIGTDKKIAWEDLNPEIDGGKLVDYHRRDYEEFSRFILTIRLYESVDSDESHEISYSVQHDVVDVLDDYSYLNIRHKTEETNFDLILPEGVEAKHANAKQDRPEESETNLHDPDVDRSGEKDKITWSYNDLSLGDRYKIHWFSEKVEN